MLHWSKRVIKIAFGIFFAQVVCAAPNPVVIHQETPTYTVDIKYPQGFAQSKVNSVIKEYITQTQQSFLNELSEDEDIPVDAPGKTGLHVTYSLLYNAKTALSVRFDVSIFHKGAAHPINTVVIHNFIKGEPVKLADLFIPGADYLKLIARYSKQSITVKKISDPKWIQEGTKPTLENYSVWFFTDTGIGIVLNTYQVAAYVYGPQTVRVSFTYFASLAKPELIKTVWSH
jgi:hypothetical protein